jgi:Predicted membrane protein
MVKAQSASLPYFQSSRKNHSRIFEIDFLRGFAIFLMIALHACCVFADVGPHGMISLPNNADNLPWVEKTVDFAYWKVFCTIDFGNLWILEFFFSSLFMFLCGVSCSFSHSNFSRGLKLAALSLAMTLALEIADTAFGLNIHIYLGILHSMAIGILFYTLVDHFWKSYWVDYGFGILFSIFDMLIFYFTYTGVNTVSATEAILPQDWWQLFLGTRRSGADYFSPVNTLAFIFLGATVGKTLYHNKKSFLPASFPTAWAKPILWCGSNSLLIYIFHMPFFYALVTLILLPFGYRLNW